MKGELPTGWAAQEPDVSVVVVSWNAKTFLVSCLQHLVAKTKSVRLEIIVVDNASQDGSADAVSAIFPQIKVIQNTSNLGFAMANNIGIRASRGRYIYLVNSDVDVHEGCIDLMCRFMDDNPSIGLAGPRVLNSDGTIQPSCRRFPTLWNNFCEAVGFERLSRKVRLFSGEEMKYFSYNKTADVDALSGCFLVARRDALEKVGLLDERFFMYSEDVDWAKRFRQAGWRVVFWPGAEVTHYGGGSSANSPVRFSVQREKALFAYWRKHHHSTSGLVLRLIYVLHHTLRLLIYSFLYIVRPSCRSRIRLSLRHNLACLRILVAA